MNIHAFESILVPSRGFLYVLVFFVSYVSFAGKVCCANPPSKGGKSLLLMKDGTSWDVESFRKEGTYLVIVVGDSRQIGGVMDPSKLLFVIPGLVLYRSF